MITPEQFRALFEPRGVVVAGASTHPGKFGFVALHNILANGYAGACSRPTATPPRSSASTPSPRSTRSPTEPPISPSSARRRRPTPTSSRACAAKGITAAFITSAGYGEAGEEGIAAQRELVALAEELGILLVGPTARGWSPPRCGCCAQIVAPYPPPGSIGIASQSGNFVSSFMNYAVLGEVGVSRASGGQRRHGGRRGL